MIVIPWRGLIAFDDAGRSVPALDDARVVISAVIIPLADIGHLNVGLIAARIAGLARVPVLVVEPLAAEPFPVAFLVPVREADVHAVGVERPGQPTRVRLFGLAIAITYSL